MWRFLKAVSRMVSLGGQGKARSGMFMARKAVPVEAREEAIGAPKYNTFSTIARCLSHGRCLCSPPIDVNDDC